MATAREIYGAAEDGEEYPRLSDYGPLLQSLGEIIAQVDEDGYSGDSFVLLRDGERWGYLCFGWGSCSGCDALQGCASWQDVEDLREFLAGRVRWDTREGTSQFLRDHDWEGDWRPALGREFAAKALAALGGVPHGR